VPRETININLSTASTYEAGAVFLATIAHPGAGEQRIRERFFAVLCREMIKQRAAEDEEWASAPQSFRPVYSTIGDETAADAIKAGFTQLDRRFVAAERLFMPFAKQHVVGRPIRVGGFAVNVNNMANLALGDLNLGAGSIGLVKSKVFKPSRPVLHAAAALVFFQKTLTAIDPGDIARVILYDAGALARVVQIAEEYRLLLPLLNDTMSPKNPVLDEETIQFVLA
jgi:hypothetical protein